MNKHIPGPWRVIAHGGARYQVEEHTETKAFSLESDYSEATARLIAAAPELLELLQEIVDRGLSMTRIAEARALITKATGEQA